MRRAEGERPNRRNVGFMCLALRRCLVVRVVYNLVMLSISFIQILRVQTSA